MHRVRGGHATSSLHARGSSWLASDAPPDGPHAASHPSATKVNEAVRRAMRHATAIFREPVQPADASRANEAGRRKGSLTARASVTDDPPVPPPLAQKRARTPISRLAGAAPDLLSDAG